MKRKYNLKKFIVIMLSLVMVVTMFAACGKKEEPAQEKLVSGELALLGSSEEEQDELFADIGFDHTFFDDLNSMIMALESKKIDCIIGLPDAVANYIANTNDKLELQNAHINTDMSLHMGTMKENKEVFDLLNDAIKTLNANGTIKNLEKEYIDSVIETGAEPASVELPVIGGAKTIKIAVTGDIPPIDFVTANGKTAGFSIALLAEISKIANINIELVSMNTGARFIALEEGRVDAVFYFNSLSDVESYSEGITDDDYPEEVSITTPYYTTTMSKYLVLAE